MASGRRQLLAVIVLLLLLTSFLLRGTIGELFVELVGSLRELGLRGALLYGLVYVIATVAVLPGSLLTLGAGFLYGPFWGAALVLVFSVLGASTAFLLARSWLRPWVVQSLGNHKRFQALDLRIGSEDWKLVFLLRLSPLMPFALLNYVLGLTSVSFRNFWIASVSGMLPGIALYSYIGSAMGTVGQLQSGGGEATLVQRLFFWGGMAATLAVTIVLTRWARVALKSYPVAAQVES